MYWRNHHISLPRSLTQTVSVCCELAIESLECSVSSQTMCCQRHRECALSWQGFCLSQISARSAPFTGFSIFMLTLRQLPLSFYKRVGEKKEALGQRVQTACPAPQSRCGRTRSECESPEGEARALIIGFLNLTHLSCCQLNYLFLPFHSCFHLNVESAWTLLLCFQKAALLLEKFLRSLTAHFPPPLPNSTRPLCLSGFSGAGVLWLEKS